jgi:hypothetical protein
MVRFVVVRETGKTPDLRRSIGKMRKFALIARLKVPQARSLGVISPGPCLKGQAREIASFFQVHPSFLGLNVTEALRSKQEEAIGRSLKRSR